MINYYARWKSKRGDTYASTLACGGHGCGNHSDMDHKVISAHKDGEGFREMKSEYAHIPC